jgi:hypothetical protein
MYFFIDLFPMLCVIDPGRVLEPISAPGGKKSINLILRSNLGPKDQTKFQNLNFGGP